MDGKLQKKGDKRLRIWQACGWHTLKNVRQTWDALDSITLVMPDAPIHSNKPGEGIMKTWNTPTFCETCVGAEINCYASNSPD